MRPDYLTSYFPQYIQKHGCKRMRFHDLRHPYVKHTTKKYNSEKQKTQATKLKLSSVSLIMRNRAVFWSPRVSSSSSS